VLEGSSTLPLRCTSRQAEGFVLLCTAKVRNAMKIRTEKVAMQPKPAASEAAEPARVIPADVPKVWTCLGTPAGYEMSLSLEAINRKAAT
jgi:hypothetical protein